ncbi:MAG: ATP-binding protein [Actinomycetota bacterium]|nr:ATP-binding protein [Actinomycetota bacterium]
MEVRFTVSLTREPKSVPLARRLCALTLSTLGCDPECVRDIKLAVTEACSNVIEHAHASERYELEFSVEGDLCNMRIIDAGTGFEPAANGHPPPPSAAENGRGLHLIGQLVDEATFDSTPERGTVVRMVKRLHMDAPTAGTTREIRSAERRAGPLEG